MCVYSFGTVHPRACTFKEIYINFVIVAPRKEKVLSAARKGDPESYGVLNPDRLYNGSRSKPSPRTKTEKRKDADINLQPGNL